MSRKFRNLLYLYHSPTDMIDLLLNLILLSMGVYLIFNPDLFSIPEFGYHRFTESHIDEICLGVYYIITSLLNLIRLILPYKIHVMVIALLKSLTFFGLLLYAVCMVIDYGSPIQLSGIAFTILSCFGLVSILRTK